MSENAYGATAAAEYGPRWQDVIEVIRKARKLTSKQFNRAVAFAAERDAAAAAVAFAASAAGREAAWSAAWNDARNAAGQDVAWAAGEFGAWAARRYTLRDAALAAGDAAAAAVVSDLVGKHGLTDKHIADLTRAWNEIISADEPWHVMLGASMSACAARWAARLVRRR